MCVACSDTSSSIPRASPSKTKSYSSSVYGTLMWYSSIDINWYQLFSIDKIIKSKYSFAFLDLCFCSRHFANPCPGSILGVTMSPLHGSHGFDSYHGSVHSGGRLWAQKFDGICGHGCFFDMFWSIDMVLLTTMHIPYITTCFMCWMFDECKVSALTVQAMQAAFMEHLTTAILTMDLTTEAGERENTVKIPERSGKPESPVVHNPQQSSRGVTFWNNITNSIQ